MFTETVLVSIGDFSYADSRVLYSMVQNKYSVFNNQVLVDLNERFGL